MPKTYRYRTWVIGILILAGLYLSSLYHYLLFHSAAEGFNIVVACGIFMIAWNVRRTLDNGYLLFLGVAYLFVAGLDALHTLAYKGMGVFPDDQTNLPTQLWIAARYLEGLSLLVAPFYINRRVSVRGLFAVLSLVIAFLLASIFAWKVFPLCFVEGVGLTPFKNVSEYVISLILLTSGALLIQRQRAFEPEILRLLLAAILLKIASELSFTFYVHAYGFSNLLGHFFKIVSFYLIYRALIETGLMKPYLLLFRELKQSEEALRKSEENYRKLIENLHEGIWVLDNEGKTLLVNPRMAEMIGYAPWEMEERSIFSFMAETEAERCKDILLRRKGEMKGRREINLLRKDGETIHTIMGTSVLTDKGGKGVGTIAAVVDFTERKKVEEELKHELLVKKGLSEVYEPLMASSSIEDIASNVLDQAKRLTGSEHGYVSSIDPETGDMIAHTLTRMRRNQCRFPGEKAKIVFPRGEGRQYRGLWGHSLNTKLSFIANTPFEHPSAIGTPEGHIPVERFLSVPVLLGEEVVGQISLANAQKPYTESDLHVIQHLAAYYALALQRRRGEEALQRAHDSLEVRVAERTHDLAQAIGELRGQIRERRRAERALRESEKRYSTLVEESLTGVYIQQEDRIVFANERFARLHGYRKEEIHGIESLTLIHPDDRAMVKAFRERRLQGEDAPSEYEARGLRKDGKVIWVARRIAVVTYDGKPAVLGNAVNITERKMMETALRNSERELRILSTQLLTAEENERKRIAQELHDSIGQSLGAIKFSLENALNQREGDGPERNPKLLKEIIPLTQKAIEEVRRIVMDLRPSTLDDLGILPTISWFCRQFQSIYSGIAVDTEIGLEERDVPDPLKTVIYRVLQEALNNIAKHSKADHVHLSLQKKASGMELVIEDNGRGFDPEGAVAMDSLKRGLGLASMRERTEISGGAFSISSAKGKGTRIHAVWPVAAGELGAAMPFQASSKTSA